jgi:acylphosphatase
MNGTAGKRGAPLADLAPRLDDDIAAARITLTGHVQGVGFRPFVYRLATQHNLQGTVQNRLGEVEVVAVGRTADLRQFQQDLVAMAPPLSRPTISASRSSKVLPAGRRKYSSHPITSCVTTAGVNCTNRAIGAFAIRSSTARSAVRATR